MTNRFRDRAPGGKLWGAQIQTFVQANGLRDAIKKQKATLFPLLQSYAPKANARIATPHPAEPFMSFVGVEYFGERDGHSVFFVNGGLTYSVYAADWERSLEWIRAALPPEALRGSGIEVLGIEILHIGG